MIFLLWVAPVALSNQRISCVVRERRGWDGRGHALSSDAVMVFNEAYIVLAGTLVDASDRS